MAEHLTEEEQLEALKRWWKENGKTTVAAIALLGAGFFGWNQYKSHQQALAEEGSAMYEAFVAAATELETATNKEENKAKVETLANDLITHNPSSLYANFAQLQLAKIAVDDGDLAAAKDQLQKVASEGENDALKELARMRLARVEFAAGNADAALAQLQGNVSDSFAGAFAELRGDIFLSQSRYEEAHSAYQSALDVISDPRSMRRSLVQLKLDNAQVASVASAATTTAEPDEASTTETPSEAQTDDAAVTADAKAGDA